MATDPQHILRNSNGTDVGQMWADGSNNFILEHAPSGEELVLDASGGTLSTLAANTVALQDAGADPASAGQIRRNGSDVKVHTGGSVINLSNVGSGGATLTDEEVRDIVDAFLVTGPNLSKTRDDPNNELLLEFTGSVSSSTAYDTVVTSETELRSAVSNASGPTMIAHTSDISLGSTLNLSGLPTESRIVSLNGAEIAFSGPESEEDAIVIDDVTDLAFYNTRFRSTGAGIDLIRFNDTGVLPYDIVFKNCKFGCSNGAQALVSKGTQPWSVHVEDSVFLGLFDDPANHYESPLGSVAYVRIGGVNNVFKKCIFGQIPDGTWAVRPATENSSGVAGYGESWLFDTCTFGGFFQSDGGAFQGLDRDGGSVVAAINPVRHVNCSYEGLIQNPLSGTHVCKFAGFASVDNGWFRENTDSSSSQIKLAFQTGGAHLDVARTAFDEQINGVDIDASNGNAMTCSVRPLKQVSHGVDDPNGLIYGEDLVAGGSTTVSGTTSVDTGVTSSTATFDVAVGVADGSASRVRGDVEWDGDSHAAVLEEVSGGNSPTVEYRVIQRSP